MTTEIKDKRLLVSSSAEVELLHLLNTTSRIFCINFSFKLLGELHMELEIFGPGLGLS